MIGSLTSIVLISFLLNFAEILIIFALYKKMLTIYFLVLTFQNKRVAELSEKILLATIFAKLIIFISH